MHVCTKTCSKIKCVFPKLNFSWSTTSITSRKSQIQTSSTSILLQTHVYWSNIMLRSTFKIHFQTYIPIRQEYPTRTIIHRKLLHKNFTYFTEPKSSRIRTINHRIQEYCRARNFQGCFDQFTILCTSRKWCFMVFPVTLIVNVSSIRANITSSKNKLPVQSSKRNSYIIKMGKRKYSQTTST